MKCNSLLIVLRNSSLLRSKEHFLLVISLMIIIELSKDYHRKPNHSLFQLLIHLVYLMKVQFQTLKNIYLRSKTVKIQIDFLYLWHYLKKLFSLFSTLKILFRLKFHKVKKILEKQYHEKYQFTFSDSALFEIGLLWD